MDGSTVSGGDDLQRETEARQPFPQNPDEFNKDPRVSYSKLDDKWILEDNDGSEWEFNDKYMRWMPSVCNPRSCYKIRLGFIGLLLAVRQHSNTQNLLLRRIAGSGSS